MRRILITGGAGFVGSSLAIRLRSHFAPAEVVVLDNLHRRGAEFNAERLERAGIPLCKADVRDAISFNLPRCDLVIDAAAEPSVMAGRFGGDDVPYVVGTNLVGTLHALEAARKWGAGFVFLSTSRVYPLEALRRIALREIADRFEIAPVQSQPGITERGISESFPLEGARTLYGATKFSGEIMVAEYATQFGLRAIINRCGVIAGPWQMGKADQGVVALWAARHWYGKALAYIGYGGRQVRDAVHVEDLADLLVRQLDGGLPEGGALYNVGGGRGVSFSLRELTVLCRAATGKTVPVAAEETIRPGDVPLYITDASRAQKAYNWRPCRDMVRIVEDSVSWIRDHEERLRGILV